MEKALQLLTSSQLSLVDSDLEIFLVNGKTDRYVSTHTYCSCAHFIHRCLKEPGRICYHILAVRIANKENFVPMEGNTLISHLLG